MGADINAALLTEVRSDLKTVLETQSKHTAELTGIQNELRRIEEGNFSKRLQDIEVQNALCEEKRSQNSEAVGDLMPRMRKIEDELLSIKVRAGVIGGAIGGALGLIPFLIDLIRAT